jgi:hypothetical protein
LLYLQFSGFVLYLLKFAIFTDTAESNSEDILIPSTSTHNEGETNLEKSAEKVLYQQKYRPAWEIEFKG